MIFIENERNDSGDLWKSVHESKIWLGFSNPQLDRSRVKDSQVPVQTIDARRSFPPLASWDASHACFSCACKEEIAFFPLLHIVANLHSIFWRF